MQKIGGRKSRWTVPLNLLSILCQQLALKNCILGQEKNLIMFWIRIRFEYRELSYNELFCSTDSRNLSIAPSYKMHKSKLVSILGIKS